MQLQFDGYKVSVCEEAKVLVIDGGGYRNVYIFNATGSYT